MYIFKGKEDNFETRLEKAKEKFKDNDMVMEQITVALQIQIGAYAEYN